MKPAPFDMVRPETLQEALNFLATVPDAKIIAGGQSLVPLMNLRMAMPSLLIDINRVGGLSGITLVGDELHIGAMTRQKELLDNPLIAAHAPLVEKAMPNIGHVQTRNRGTVGGSLAHADPAAELPLVLTALDGALVVESVRGARTIKARSFFIDALTTAMASDEILTKVCVACAPAGTRAAFREFARRHGDFAIAAAAVQLTVNEGGGVSLHAAIGGVGNRPKACRDLEISAAAGVASPHVLAALVDEEIKNLEPQSDLQASAEYRRTLAQIALQDCLADVLA
jgi:CO/xanthine dehydrogenase FAD-binding subunit